MGHCRAFAAFWLFHKQQKWHHYQEHTAQEPEYVVVRQHGRLPLHHAPNSNLGLVRSRYWVGSLGYKPGA